MLRRITVRYKLIERIDSRHGMHTLEHAEAIGLGNQKYKSMSW